MTTDKQLWKYPLPDDWTPVGYWCVQITIPADQQYMDILTGALGALTQSKPYQPDVTGDGPAAVAYAWEQALYSTQYSVNQGCIITPQPITTTEAEAQDWAAGIITNFFQRIAGEFNTCASAPGDCAGCVDTVYGELEPYGATVAVRAQLSALCNHLTALSPTERAQYTTDCVYVSQFNDLSSKMKDNPYDWLNKLSDWLFNFLNTTADQVFYDLNMAAGLLGGHGVTSYVKDHGGAGGGATFGDTCPWVDTFDFTTSPYTWVPYNGGYDFAEYTSGGFAAVPLVGGSCPPGEASTVLDFQTGCVITELTLFEVIGVAGDDSCGGTRGLYTEHGKLMSIPPTGGAFDVTWTGVLADVHVLYVACDTCCGVSSDSVVTKVIVGGIGTHTYS